MMEFVSQNLWVLWTAAVVAFLVVEVLTTSLVAIWFVPGAVLSAVISLFWDSFVGQTVIFLAVSVICLILCKKYYRPEKIVNLPETNEQLIGRTAKAVSDIGTLEGKVLVGDVHWRAVSENEISKDSLVEITGVNGTTLTVKSK